MTSRGWINLSYTISTKIETLRLDGETMYQFHGGLRFGDAEPLQAAMSVPLEIWNSWQVGETIVFISTDLPGGLPEL